MRKQRYLWIFAVVMVLAISGIGFIAQNLLGKDAANTTLITTTEDIGARVESNVKLDSASFRPMLTDIDAIAKARKYMGEGFNLPNPELLPVRVTVATYTGEQEGPKGFVENLKVRVVVFDDFPFVLPGPPSSTAKLVDPRFTVVIDDQTGEVVYGATTAVKGSE